MANISPDTPTPPKTQTGYCRSRLTPREKEALRLIKEAREVLNESNNDLNKTQDIVDQSAERIKSIIKEIDAYNASVDHVFPKTHHYQRRRALSRQH